MKHEKSLKSKAIYGFLWSFLDLIMNQGFQFVIQIILARILLPEYFGVIGMITIFISISNTLIDGGFSNALVREKTVSQKDYSTIFYINLIISVLLYIILFFSAPAISNFFNERILIHILRILSISLIINSFGLIQRTMLIKKIDFKTQAKINAVSSLLSGGIGIVAAIIGMGIWSLVIRTLSMSFIQTILLFLYNRWVPALIFDINSFKKFFKYGWKMLASSLLDTFYNNLYYLIIGKSFFALELGYYTNADKLKCTVSQSLTGAIQKVSYPVLSNIEGGDNKLKSGYKKIIKNCTFIIFPIMTGLAAIGQPMITLLFGEKWSHSIIYFQILCLEGMLYPIHSINLNILQVKGRSDLFLKLEVVKKIIGISIIILVLALRLGMMGIMWGIVLECYITYFINACYSNILIGYSIREQINDIYSNFFTSVIMGVIVYCFGMIFSFSNIIILLIQILLGILSYLLLNKIIKREELNTILEFVTQFKHRRILSK
ncbi:MULTISPECIES: lipopolysaccharide biosynthesis protein [unclassified Clostridium]|uniref:lipopolysaccharide biosynthesis protein n=1 Tax=unclassified Clostridium TaxID=2614128 RepID=UPI000298026D|nr:MULTISPECIES: lipopolysaccharide biosynthesis protein [unclassified Clostridium]EKQ56939.1 MAG: membrane protein involved in the export of O-antigen and teichoic acid [Clostridium sp. Maddingley MBC34-26]